MTASVLVSASTMLPTASTCRLLRMRQSKQGAGGLLPCCWKFKRAARSTGVVSGILAPCCGCHPVPMCIIACLTGAWAEHVHASLQEHLPSSSTACDPSQHANASHQAGRAIRHAAAHRHGKQGCCSCARAAGSSGRTASATKVVQHVKPLALCEVVNNQQLDLLLAEC